MFSRARGTCRQLPRRDGGRRALVRRERMGCKFVTSPSVRGGEAPRLRVRLSGDAIERWRRTHLSDPLMQLGRTWSPPGEAEVPTPGPSRPAAGRAVSQGDNQRVAPRSIRLRLTSEGGARGSFERFRSLPVQMWSKQHSADEILALWYSRRLCGRDV